MRAYVFLIAIILAVSAFALDQYEDRSLRDILLIEDDAERLSAFDAWAKELISSSQLPAEFGDWQYAESKDEMAGNVSSRYVFAYSDNVLSGWLDSGNLLLGVTCPASVYVRANTLGFASEYGSGVGSQSMRVRFGDGPVHSVLWYVWESTNDGASLGEAASAAFIQSMLSSESLMIEVELFGTEGRKEVAHLNLRRIQGCV